MHTCYVLQHPARHLNDLLVKFTLRMLTYKTSKSCLRVHQLIEKKEEGLIH